MDALDPNRAPEEPTAGSRRARIADERGFSLVELLTVMVTLIIVLLAALAMFEFAQRTQPRISERNDAIQTAQIEIERLVQDLRQGYLVESATPQALTVLTYDNKATCAGATPGASRECRVTYECEAGTCTRTASEADGSGPGAPRTLIDGLASDSVFSYSPSATAPTTVFVRFQMQSDDGAPGEDLITLEEGVTMRNVATGR
jgi:type II secretory pathway pseudopilin PulG